ncbi:hypothetical protein FEH10_06805 [Escherichia coli]|nr:hypothetical protein [Escherichia coli]
MICRFIDTHCHFDFPPFSGDEEASLQRAAQAGVGKIIVPATEAENFARVQALAEKYQPLYAALGLHPGMLEKHSDVSLDQLQQALERRPAKVVAVGEIGLDLFGDDPQFERQQWLLDEQLKLAKRYDLPLNGFQGQPNRPEQAVRVFDVLCELRPEPEDEIAEVLLNNTYALFSVSG